MSENKEPYRWHENEQENQLELLVSGKVLAVIIGWKDKKTGEHCGYTSSINLKNGQEKSINFQTDTYESIETAKKATLSAIAEHYENSLDIDFNIEGIQHIKPSEKPEPPPTQAKNPDHLLNAISSILTLAGIPAQNHAETLQSLATTLSRSEAQ